ncbi:MAG: inositol monophosphatase family protein, partial [Myxococcota bacterium]
MSESYGVINAHVVGTLMKEAVRRAIVAIRAQRFTFEARVKGVGPTGSPDLVTTADRAAQRVFVKLLRDWFPTFGVVAEEDDLSVPCTEPGQDLWFSVDPLDGTKAFVRRQSTGIGTMIALACDGEVVAACVGDVMTQEVYATRPESAEVYRISEFGVAEQLAINADRTLAEQWLQLRDRPTNYSPTVQALVSRDQPLFRAFEVTNGSIGVGMARLWKGEVAGAVIRPGLGTPWDLCPVLGICRKLGFVFVSIAPECSEFELFELPVIPTLVDIEHE